jgi:hypothetical protein
MRATVSRKADEVAANQYENLDIPKYRTNAGKQPPQVDTEDVFTPQHHRDYRPYIVAGMLAFLGIWIFVQAVLIPWFQGIINQWQYGNAKVSETDINVGHGGMSHFYAFEKDGVITILEIVGKKSQVYQETVEASGNRVVTLTAQDVSVKGRLDVIIHIQDLSTTPILYNTGSAFSWTLKNS